MDRPTVPSNAVPAHAAGPEPAAPGPSAEDPLFELDDVLVAGGDPSRTGADRTDGAEDSRASGAGGAGPARPHRLRVEHLALPVEGITMVTGPSGSGKSTLLRLLNRLDVPDRGVVRFRGRPLDELDPLQLRCRVGMVFQRPTLFAGTVADNLTVARRRADRDDDLRLLERVGLAGTGDVADLHGRSSDELSGGQAQLVCLARALTVDPEVLLLDEPTSSLDPASARRVEDAVRRMADEGLSIVWVSHDPSQLERVGDRELRLEAGAPAGSRRIDRRVGSPDPDRDPGTDAPPGRVGSGPVDTGGSA